MYRLILVLAAAAWLGQVDTVEAGHCNHCGCSSGCKVCKLVPEVRKIASVEYRLQCEDMCLHGRSRCVGTKQVCDCNGCPQCEKIMQPTCGCVLTIRKLVKVPVVREECGWKCVVVNRCGNCSNCTSQLREATEAEKQLAIQEAERLGILQVSAEEPIEVVIPDDAPAAMAPVAAQPLFASPALLQSAAAQPATIQTTEENRSALRIFGSMFGK
jgi:hypothetical protein